MSGRWVPCLDCDELTRNGTRCEDCARERNRVRDARRGKTSTRYGKEYQRNRKVLLEGGPYPCALQYWGCTGVGDTADHIVPKSSGGTDDLENLQPACKNCNSAKGNS